MNERITNGTMTIEEAEYFNHELRSKAATPEEITTESVEERMQYLGYEGFEAHVREKSRLEQVGRDGEAAKLELVAIQAQQVERKRIRTVRKAKAKIILLCLGLLLVVGAALVLFIVLVAEFRSDSDSPLTILGLVISLLSFLIPLFKLKKIKNWLTEKYNAWSGLE
jgi:hypothetical protein